MKKFRPSKIIAIYVMINRYKIEFEISSAVRCTILFLGYAQRKASVSKLRKYRISSKVEQIKLYNNDYNCINKF